MRLCEISQLVKTKRQPNFKDFKRFEAFKGLFWRSWAKKIPIYTRTR
jgi:hypothetical protein